MKKHLTLLGVAAMATAVFAGCSNDEIVDSYQGEEISFKTRIETRATELTKDNLGDFSVIAKGIHPGGDLYEAYLIGDQIGGEVATKAADSDVWNLGRKVYWPSDMEQVLFWAYTTKHKDDPSTDGILSSGTVEFDQNNGPKIKDFIPAKADLAATSVTGKWNDGDYQKDLLVAFQDQKKKSENNYVSVPLTFQHALSQVSIKAVQKEKVSSDHRIVKIKGAWIVNVSTKGDLNAKLETAGEGAGMSFINNPTWEALNEASGYYGSYSNISYDLGTTPTNILGSDGRLMIIPQTVSKWDKAETSTTGAYILLLCRVELEHEGATHDGSDYIGEDIGVEGNKHYHQLFPVNAADKYKKHEYGFTCVPLSAEWKMGKRYTYTLDICGASSGAGVYPPVISKDIWENFVPSDELASPDDELSSDSKKVIIVNTRPAGKKIGDPVLDAPISFTVDVAEWTDAENFNGETAM